MALDNVTSHLSTMLEPIASASFLSSLSIIHDDIPSTCVCGDAFTVDHAMICKRGGFVTQRHNELRDLEAELLNMVCTDVELEPVLQDISG